MGVQTLMAVQHVGCAANPAFVEKIFVTKFSIKAYNVEKNCEECGDCYPPQHNFGVVACCGESVRCCFYCTWKSVPCQTCRVEKHGLILINKMQNTCR